MHNQETPEMQDTSLLNQPPYSLEAEQMLLGMLMLDNFLFVQIADMLNSEAFYRVDHRIIYASMETLVKQRQPIDVVTLSAYIDEIGMLEQIGGIGYLGQIACNATDVNVVACARTIQGCAARRRIIEAGKEIIAMSYETDGRSGTEVLEEAERKLYRIATGRDPKEPSPSFGEGLRATVETIEKQYLSGSFISGLTTGFTALDQVTSGLQDSELIVLGGRPSMGKTALAMNLINSALLNTDKHVVVFSLEMTTQAFITRFISSSTCIDHTKLRTGKLEDDDWTNMINAVSFLAETKLHIEDDMCVSAAQMRSKTQYISLVYGEIGLIVVDYFQLVRMERGAENRASEMAEVARSLKAMAREFNCPVVVLSQLNRSLEKRPNKRPINSDLRDSGAIEQDADVILLIYRDEIYYPDTKYPGMAEVTVSKQRNGPTKTVHLAFNHKNVRFENLADGQIDFED